MRLYSHFLRPNLKNLSRGLDLNMAGSTSNCVQFFKIRLEFIKFEHTGPRPKLKTKPKLQIRNTVMKYNFDLKFNLKGTFYYCSYLDFFLFKS